MQQVVILLSRATSSDGDGKALVIPYQGAVGQTQVRAGHYAADSNGDPSSSGAIREEPCLLGFYSSDVGASQCTQVRAGYFTTDGAGTAVDTAAEAEEACSSGYFSSTAGASACTQVQAGYFATNGTGTGVNAAAVAEEICDAGYYSAAGATVCTACEAGKFALFMSAGATSSDTCLDCNSGYTTDSPATVAANGEVESEKDSICVCALGYGRETSGDDSTSCTICSPGYFSGTTDDTSCNEVAQDSTKVLQEAHPASPALQVSTWRQAT